MSCALSDFAVTYPVVTCSNPTAGGASADTEIDPVKITRVIGILRNKQRVAKK